MTSPMILIVDDDPDARAMLSTALTQAGFLAQTAADGEAALAAALRSPPDLVLMDAVMPGMGGFEACRKLKGLIGFGDRPVVFMTGLTETQHVVEGLQAGGVDYVTKPVVLDELIARVRVHLANARLAISARSALDMAGRALLAADSLGRLLWRTPQAEELLGEFDLADNADILRILIGAGPDRAGSPQALRVGERRLSLSYIGREGDEHFFRLTESTEGREELILRDALGLTSREADVLVWIARGKSNRDISDILNISARTVNKHLEQVFTKLGVENRAAAAAIATRVVAGRS